jgi:hypothetical protein
MIDRAVPAICRQGDREITLPGKKPTRWGSKGGANRYPLRRIGDQRQGERLRPQYRPSSFPVRAIGCDLAFHLDHVHGLTDRQGMLSFVPPPIPYGLFKNAVGMPALCSCLISPRWRWSCMRLPHNEDHFVRRLRWVFQD